MGSQRRYADASARIYSRTPSTAIHSRKFIGCSEARQDRHRGDVVSVRTAVQIEVQTVHRTAGRRPVVVVMGLAEHC